MDFGSGALRRWPVAIWVAVLIAVVVLALLPSYICGWDLAIYRTALVSLRAGRDPFLDAIAVQKVFHATLAQHPHDTPPYSYVYSPMTLPFLRWVARFRFGRSAAVYWMLYAACTWTTVRIGWWSAERDERWIFAMLAPVSIFFPGLLHQDTILSGNVAFILYGCALGAAFLGWRRGLWMPFYAVVLVASIFKAPLLSLLAIPVFSARKQWLPAGLSALAGLVLFAVQPAIWPGAFRHYLEAVDLQFQFNRDFSSSPAGVAADLLFRVVSYRVVSPLVYVAYAAAVARALYWFSRRYLDGFLRLSQWIPVLLVGVVLLNPRIMEYDVAPIAMPMALVMWRVFRRGPGMGAGVRVGVAALRFGAFFAVANVLAAWAWKPTECGLLVVVFAAGCRDLKQQVRAAEGAARAGAARSYAMAQ